MLKLLTYVRIKANEYDDDNPLRTTYESHNTNAETQHTDIHIRIDLKNVPQ
jgi:hypothetical protein